MKNLSLDIQQALFDAVARVADGSTAIKNILSNICEFACWGYGEAWIPCKEGIILELYPASYITDRRSKAEVFSLEQFRTCTEGFSFPPAIGLPGRVWASQKPEWLSDASSQSESIFYGIKSLRLLVLKLDLAFPFSPAIEC